MTPLKQQISLIPFSIEHWSGILDSGNPYKRRRFENRWDQTFCTLLIIKDVRSVIESANVAKIWNKSDPDSNSNFRINLDPDVRRISVPKSWIHSSASFISPSLVQIGCWLHENWENREVLTNVGKWLIPQWWRKWKTGIQQISLIPFSIEHWYSPYKRRRFENLSDQTFCILLIKDVLSVIESANLCRRQNLKRKWSGFKFNFLD